MNKDNNNMYVKPQYKCAICEKVYDDVQDRMNCEMKCLKKKQEEEKKAAEAKKKAEKDARKKEVDEAFESFMKLYDAYTKDYGSCTLDYGAENRHITLNTQPKGYFSPWPSKIFNDFWY